ncbi:MAG: molybdopterin molybdotransferase MoeA [Bacteroidetes bacterium]|nr:molybdopterin molybdotransferase MoeA [Bacteroidota bacterium]
MISVEEAKNLVLTGVFKQQKVLVNIQSALNFFLADDIIAGFSVPLFNQSAMDGYAFKFQDVNKSLNIVDEVAAGDVRVVKIKQGEAIRIFTGSKVPDSCDTVVMQELTEIINNQLIVKDDGLKSGGNIRKKGYQLKKGDVALKKGTLITPAAIGFMATLGIQEVNVYELPKVYIIATGSELMPLGSKLKEGQIFESNTHMLCSALEKLAIQPIIYTVKDNQQETEQLIKEALTKGDLLILSGGISVGDYDFVKESLVKNQVKEVFYKIKQKPGKPLFYGQKGEKNIFALPGNPAAALNCFYMYVYPAIQLMLGASEPFLPMIKLPLENKFVKKEGRSHFLKAKLWGNTVKLLEGQDSDALQSFALANALVYIPAEKITIEQHELVDVYLLPN